MKFAAFLIFFSVGASLVECDVCFTPGMDCDIRIIKAIQSAKKSIYVQSYSFTSLPIANALIGAGSRGVDIVIIVDKSQVNNIIVLKMARYLKVFIDRPKGIAHNKVMIIDGYIVLTGSYNFTKSAQFRNVENSVQLKSKELAQIYKEQWDKRFALCKRLVI